MNTSSGKEAVANNRISLVELFQIAWKHKWLVFGLTVGSTLLGLVVSLVLPKTYEATATVFPVSSPTSLAQYAGLASLAGLSLPDQSSGSEPSKIVGALMASRLLAEALATDLDLVHVLRKEGRRASDEVTDGELQRAVSLVMKAISYKKEPSTGVISIQVEWPDPEMAQTLCNRLVSVLDKLLVEKSLTTSKKKAESLQKQIETQKAKLDAYQSQLAQFQKETSLLNPSAQSTRAVDTYTTMIQQKMNLELQLANAEAAYSQGNPKILVLKNQIVNLEDQIKQVRTQVDGDLPSLRSAPETLIRFQNLSRDLEIASKLYSGLLASQEQTRLEDDSEQVYIEMLDKALLPRSPKQSPFVAIGLAGFAGLGLAFIVVGILEFSRVRRSLKIS